MYDGVPNVALLDPSIATSTLIAKAPSPRVHVLHYQAFDVPSNKFYSNYQVTRDRTTTNFSQYHTIENVRDNGIAHGYGLGYGGIFSIIYLKQGDIPNAPHWYKKYRWTMINNLQGQLFPLQVGNQLTFNYHEQVKYTPSNNNLSDEENDGKIVYQIIDHQVGYHNGNLSVPGDIYVVRFSKSTNNGPMQIQNDYYFSTYLGWYVQAAYYFNNQEMAVYKMTGWEQ